MKFYEKIIGLNKNAPSDELIITFSNSGFEFNRNIYLDEGKGISLSGGENAVISFRVGDPINIYKDLDSGTLTFASNGKNLDFDFGVQSGFNGGAIYAYDWSLGGPYSPLNRIYSTNGYFDKLLPLETSNKSIGASNNYWESIYSDEITANSIEISSSLEVLGDITGTNLYGNTAFTDHPNDWIAIQDVAGYDYSFTEIESNKTYQVMISIDEGDPFVQGTELFSHWPIFVGLYNNMTAFYNTDPIRGQGRYMYTTFSFNYSPTTETTEAYILLIRGNGTFVLRKWDKEEDYWKPVNGGYTLFFRKIN